MHIQTGKILKTSFKILLWLVSFFLLVLVLILIFIRTEKGQDIIRKEAVSYLTKKLKTSVSIGRFRTDILSHIELQGITISDQSEKQLFHIGNININYQLLDLLNNTLSVKEVTVDTLYFRMGRAESDASYNFDFIIQAFSGSASDTESNNTTGTPIDLNIGNLIIRQLHYLLEDKKDCRYFDIKSREIVVCVEKLDLAQQIYKVKDVRTEGVSAKVEIGVTGSDNEVAENQGLLPQIIIAEMSLLNSSCSIQMPGSGYQSEITIHNFFAEDLNLNLNANKLFVNQLYVDQHQSQILLKPVETQQATVAVSKSEDPESHPLSIAIGSINLKDNDLKYDLNEEPRNTNANFNQDHIHLKQLSLLLNDFVFNEGTIQGSVKQLHSKEQCGFELQQLTTDFVYADTGVCLDNFLLKTPMSVMEGNFRISYQSLASVIQNPGLLGFNINVKKMLLADSEMKHFSSLVGNNKDIKKILASSICLEGKLNGKVSDMLVENLKISTAGMRLAVGGHIAGLPDPDQLKATINLNEFSGSTKNLAAVLPVGSIPSTIAANENFTIKGRLGINQNSYVFALRMNSSAGFLALNGNVKLLTGAEKISYNLNAFSDCLQVDRIMMDTLYGNTAFEILAEGEGVSLKTAAVRATAHIPTVRLKGYDYKNIDLTASLLSSVVQADIKIQDSAVASVISATYSPDSLKPILKATAHVDNIDLRRLGFIADTLRFKGDLSADITNFDSKHINGTIQIPAIEISKGSDVYKLDSISFVAVNVDSTQSIAIKSSILDLTLQGYYEIDVLPSVAQNLLIDYFTVYPPTGTVFKPAYAKLKGKLHYHPVIPAFVPGFTFTKTIQFGSIVNTKEKELMFAVIVPSAVYHDFIIDSTIFGIHTVHDSLLYGLESFGFKNNSVALEHSQIEGNARDGVINLDIKLFDGHDSLKYNLAGHIVNDTTKFVLHLDENQFINAEKWTANADNETEYTKTNHLHTNLALTSGKKQLLLQSTQGETGLPLDLKLVDFPVTTLTKLVSIDTSIVTGSINGQARLTSFEPLQFMTDLKIDSVTAYGYNAGNLSIKANNKPGVGYEGQVNLEGNENEIDIETTYSDNGDLKGKLDIHKFNVRTVEPFLGSLISGVQGTMNGKVEFEGTMEKPILNGSLDMRDIQGRYKDYNTFFRIPEGQIHLSKGGISINPFVVFDSTGNTAKVHGQVYTTDFRNFNYDLTVKTDHFLALDKKSNSAQEYYGPAYFTSDLRILSSGDVLTVKGDVKVDEKSELNVEMNSVDTTIATSNGIIVYVDSLQGADSALANLLKTELMAKTSSVKIGLALNLEMTKSSKLNIFLDKSGGDYMKVAGDANLTINQLPGGQMNMQGKFTMDNGEYQMVLSRVIKRRFIVQKGSSIQWNGLPTDANIDLTALYNVETTAEAILAGSQTSNKGAYKQQLPFEVYLILKKKLMQPAISFKLDMPVKEQNAFSGVVYARVKQINLNESELNKQVMGLLLLNQFVPADPLASGSGSMTLFDYESMARNTAGALVSQQLNSLISSRFKNVDLNFDVYSKADYSSGEKSNTTDLNVSLSRTMFNDRYTISVGNTFALEGSEEHKRNTSALAGNYSAEYKITRDGRYRVKAYKKDQYDADNSGQVIQTGLGFLLFLDFNKYRDIFKKQSTPNPK